MAQGHSQTVSSHDRPLLQNAFLKGAAFVLLALSFTLTSRADDTAPPVVVVELFTSQGCSSCPDAEHVLSTWGKSGFEKKEILPLAFHVHYWDHLGWKDPFSSSEFTNRQTSYNAALGNPSIYTPQMVVAGKSAFVGSNQAKASEEVRRFAKKPAPAHLELAYSWDAGTLRFTAKTALAPGTSSPLPRAIFQLVIFENGLVTRVERGENTGRTLPCDFVVRHFSSLGTFPLENARPFQIETSVSWDSKWKKENAGAAILLQDPVSLEILSAEVTYPLT